ncbi:MAG: hypothetical protein AB7V43_12955 [Acidimicrobiia bacterium]
MSEPSSSDWPRQIADSVERTIGQVRDRATGPALTVVRLVAFGMLLAILGIVALVLLAIASVRFVNSYVPGDVWAAHLIVGSVFSLAGLWLFSKRHRPAED